MEANACKTCLKSSTPIQCGLCHESVCKGCASFLSDEDFLFTERRPEILLHDAYCPSCFEAQIAEPLKAYRDTLARAEQIDVYFKNQSKETRLIRRHEKALHIASCADRDELILRLAFLAADRNCNALVDVDLKAKKEGQGSYQKFVWSGSGIPANVHARQIPSDKSIWHNPN